MSKYNVVKNMKVVDRDEEKAAIRLIGSTLFLTPEVDALHDAILGIGTSRTNNEPEIDLEDDFEDDWDELEPTAEQLKKTAEQLKKEEAKEEAA